MDRPTALHRFYAIQNTHPSVVAVNGSPEMGDEVALNKDDQPVILDESKIAPEIVKINAEYENDYKRKRMEDYDQLNQFEMQFDDQRDGTTTWVDKINEIKQRHPK